MKLTINISQRVWEKWFLTSLIVEALALLIVTTMQDINIETAVLFLILSVNLFISILIGLRKY